MWQARMFEIVEVMEWKTSWEYDSGLVITTWKAVIKKKKKKLEVNIKFWVLKSCWKEVNEQEISLQGKIFLKGGDLP